VRGESAKLTENSRDADSGMAGVEMTGFSDGIGFSVVSGKEWDTRTGKIAAKTPEKR